jgi:lipopolysaccharide transport system permease protein
MFDTAISNRFLILRLVRRELALKYAGSVLGAAWTVLTPLLMLLLYTGFFSVVMKSKWGGAGFESKSFSLLLFAGLLVHIFYAEVLVGAPNLIVNNANYVKKTVFPLEVLSIVQTLTAAVALLVNLVLLLLFVTIAEGVPSVTTLFSIFILLPLFLVALGTSWLLSALGVYFRDISQLSGLLSSILLFASPVFYPVSALPEKYQILLYLNPLTFIIEQLRVVVLAQGVPNFGVLIAYYVGALLFCGTGFYCLKRLKSGFADVL